MSVNEEDRGFKNCEEDYLIPLQSRLQELIVDIQHDEQDRNLAWSIGEIVEQLKCALKDSDFRKQWKV